MSNKHLILAVPGILPEPQLQFPSFRLLLESAEIDSAVAMDVNEILFQFFQSEVSGNIAAITALADGLPAAQGWWLRADPVQLHANQQTLFLLGNVHLQLTQLEMEELVATLKPFLAESDIALYAPTSQRWYLNVKRDPDIQTYPIEKVINKNIENFLPIGVEHSYWRTLLTELQMLLHSHAVNLHRAEEAKPLVNSLWFSGSGCLPTDMRSSLKFVWSDSVLAHGLASLARIGFFKNIPSFQDCLDQMNNDGDYLVLTEQIYWQKIMQDKLNWQASVQELENNWFLPIVSALRKKQIACVSLYLGDNKIYKITRKNLRRWWQWPRKIA